MPRPHPIAPLVLTRAALQRLAPIPPLPPCRCNGSRSMWDCPGCVATMGYIDQASAHLIELGYEVGRRTFGPVAAAFDGFGSPPVLIPAIIPAAQRARPVRGLLAAQVIKRDGGRCRMCGSAERLEADHIIPRARGGQTTLGNLQALCHDCNVAKGDCWPEAVS